MPAPSGFEFRERGDEVVITHRGRPATVLRGDAAARFLDEVEAGHNAQPLMAKATGNYRRGNERAARQHPRHQGR